MWDLKKMGLYGMNFPKRGSFGVNVVKFERKFAFFQLKINKIIQNKRTRQKKLKFYVEILEKRFIGCGL